MLIAFSPCHRALLGDCAAPGDKSVLRRPHGHPPAAEVRRELGEEVRPLLSENPRLRLGKTGSVTSTHIWTLHPLFLNDTAATVYHPYEIIQRDIWTTFSVQRVSVSVPETYKSKDHFKTNDSVQVNELPKTRSLILGSPRHGRSFNESVLTGFNSERADSVPGQLEHILIRVCFVNSKLAKDFFGQQWSQQCAP